MCSERRGWTALVPAAMLGVVACNGTTSYLDATGTSGRQEALLGTWLTVTAAAVVLAVCIAILLGMARHRGEHNEPDRDSDAAPQRREIRSGLGWLYVGTSITIAILLVTFAGTMVTLNAASHPPREPSLTLDVTGHQWWWEVRYSESGHPELGFVTANEVHLPVGIPVRVRLHSADVIHSFWLPQIAGKTDVIPGQVNEMWLEAKRPGNSRGACGEYCGLQHAAMALAVTAESPDAFNRWTMARRAESLPPQTPDASAGQVIFTRTCGACHAVEGTMALGRVGPDLTHLASRPFIGAGALHNTPANLARWIVDAPAIKEGARMPAIPLDSAQVRSIVAYLQTLR